MITCYNMSFRLYFPFYSWRLDWNCSCQFVSWHCPSWHILCSCALPLCAVNRSCICYYRRICSLIPTILRVHSQWYMSQNPLCNYICRCKYNFLSTTLPRIIWHATTLLRLPGCIHNMKHHFIYRLIHFSNSSYINNFHYLRSICVQTRSLNRRTNNNKFRVTKWMSPTISYIWRTYIR